MEILLGIDLGTESARVGLYGIQGQELAVAAEPLLTVKSGPGRAEQDPNQWWEALGKASRRALSNYPDAKVLGVCVSTTASTVIACDKNGNSIRPAIMWMDTRAWRQAQRSKDISHTLLRYSGGHNAAEWLVSKAAWLRQNEKALFERADFIIEAIDFVNFKLSGLWVSSLMNSTCKANLDPKTQKYDVELFSNLGVPGLDTKLPVSVIAIGEPIGSITDEAAQHLGLSGNPLLAQGGIDAHIGMLGGGCAEPNKVFIIGGTSNVQLALTENEVSIPGIWGPYPNVLINGMNLLEGGQISSGSILRWFTRDILELDNAGTEKFILKVLSSNPEKNGLLSLDFWMGNRSPLRDDLLRGAIVGLSLNNSSEEIYAALVQGVAFGTKRVLDSYELYGVSGHDIVLSGGIRQNPAWLQITADVLGKGLSVSESENLTTLSCAISAAAALGLYPNLRTAAKEMKSPTYQIEPRIEAYRSHQEKYELYLELSATLTPILHELSLRSEVQ